MTAHDESADEPSLPDVEVDREFAAPWQARAFGLAVAATDAADLDWERFQSRLVAEIEDGGDGAQSQSDAGTADDREAAYYEDWLAALERLLVADGHLEPDELAERVAEFEAGDRTAHEFVDGDPHAHADDLPEGHAEGSAHDHGDGHEHNHSDGHGHSHGDGHDHNHGDAHGHEHSHSDEQADE